MFAKTWLSMCLPFVNFKLLRGTTALEVKAPPVHFCFVSFD